MRRFSPRQLLRQNARLSYHDMILEKSGLVSYWNFGTGSGDKLWDQKGTNHGDITGATWTQKSNGLWTLDFDGNDYVDAGSDSSLDITATITITTWIKESSHSDSHAIGTKYDVGLNERSYRFISREGQPLFNFSTNGLHQGRNLIEGNTVIDDSNWHHVVATREGATMKLYVDGALDTTKVDANASTIYVSSSNFKVGSRDDKEYMNGLINEVAIYNVALSPATILRHYTVGVWGGLADA